MITAVNIPKYSLAGNPVIVSINTDSDKEIFLQVIHNNQLIYYCSGFRFENNVLEFNISEPLSTILLSPVPDTLGVTLQELSGFIQPYSIVVWEEGEENNPTNKADLFVLSGGIDGENFRSLLNEGVSYAEKRYFEDNVNYFLTSRNADNVINIRENELFPLTLIHSGGPLSFRIYNENEDIFNYPTTNLSIEAYALNIGNIVTHFRNNNKPANMLRIYRNDAYLPVTINILPALPATNTRRIFFKNSLGAFECIALTGLMSLHHERNFDEKTYMKRIGHEQYLLCRERVAEDISFKGSAGYKTQSEMFFLADMLGSDEVYLEGSDSVLQRVIAKTDDDIISLNDERTPASIEINLTLAETNKYQRPTFFASEQQEFQVLVDNEEDFVIDEEDTFITDFI